MRGMRLLVVSVLALGSVLVWADTVTCLDGRQFDGEVLEENDQTIKIRTAAGTLTLSRADVKSIERNVSPVQTLRARREALATDDAKGRWELVDFCLKHKLNRDAELLLNEILSMASPLYAQATRKLADILATKDPKRAVELLDALGERNNDAEARIKAREIKRTLDEMRQKTYDEGLDAVKARNFHDAIETLRYAYQLSYPGTPASGAKVSEQDVLAKLAEVRATAERLVRARSTPQPPPEGAPVAIMPQKVDIVCRKCPDSGGWRTCHQCQGKGKVEQIIPAQFTAAGVIPERKVTVVCPTCTGTLKARCPDCLGSGIDLQKLDSKARPVVKSIADAAWGRPNDEPSRAMKDLSGKAVLDKLKLPDGFTPGYPTTKNLRKQVPSVPVGNDWEKSPEYQKFKAEWRALPRQERAQFLCCYAHEAAGNALPAAGATGTGEPAPEVAAEPEKLDLDKIRLTAPTVAATLVSALPEDWAGRWVYVSADYKGPDASLTGRDRVAFEVGTKPPHNLHPFAFIEAAKAIHAANAKEKNAPPLLATLVARYPYRDMDRRANALKPGDHLQMFGRVLYRKDRDPETSLEVWDFNVDINPEVAALLELVRKPVTFHFEETPLTEAVQLLSLLTGTRIRIDAPKEALMNVNLRVTQAPLAFAMRDLLKEAKLAWVFDEQAQALKIVQEVKQEELTRRDDVLRHLK